MRLFVESLLCLFVFASCMTCSQAVNHYVRQGAGGSGNDWGNAYGELPANLVRGETYYIADGNYPSYTFDDAVSGSQWITIKKATASDHGTDTGWQTSYGDGQTVFNSILEFTSSYYTFDGQTRNEKDWFDGEAYGFKVAHNNKDQNIVVGTYGSGGNNITIKYVYIEALSSLPDNTLRRYAVDTDSFDSGAVRTGLLFHRMYISGSCNQWFLRTTNRATVEYSASSGAKSNNANHGEVWNLYYSGNNAVIRYNKVKDSFIGSAGTAIVAITYADGLEFYGNIVWDFQTGDAAIGYLGYYSSNNKVYDNTFSGSTWGGSGVAFGSGTNNVAYNNIWVNCVNVNFQAVSHDYNAFSDSSTHGESHVQENFPTSRFLNYTGRDFRLTGPTNAGLTLSYPHNQDMLGNTRGADGVWDIGAYEYSSGQQAPTCSQQAGTCCSSGQACSGTTKAASDCSTCCIGTCQTQQTCIVGDLNCDKKVDIFDLVLVAQNYGKTTGFDTKADANKDGRVDIFDLVVVAQNYGKTG